MKHNNHARIFPSLLFSIAIQKEKSKRKKVQMFGVFVLRDVCRYECIVMRQVDILTMQMKESSVSIAGQNN